MKVCSRHISDLNAAIRRKGMGRLISPTEAESKRRAELWLAGRSTPRDIDPLAIAVLEIASKAQQILPIALNGSAWCPLCEVVRILRKQDADEIWIDNCSDMMVVLCRVNNIALPGS